MYRTIEDINCGIVEVSVLKGKQIDSDMVTIYVNYFLCQLLSQESRAPEKI